MWGNNQGGRIGDGTKTAVYTPKKILSNVKAVSLGVRHSGAITENGDLYMWGENFSGQIGDGTTTDVYTPKKILSNVKAVSLGAVHSGAITENGDLYMWGNNYDGRIGDGTNMDRHTPTYIMNIGTLALKSVLKAPKLSAAANNGDGVITKTFKNLQPNTIYNLYVLKDNNAENPLSAENVLYINQAVTDENGVAEFTYSALDENGLEIAGIISAEAFVKKQKVLISLAGDVNADYTVDATDLVRLKKFLAGQDVDYNEFNADCNGDNSVDATDLVRLKKYLAGQNVTLG